MTTEHTKVNQERSESVLIWVEMVAIPTYGTGEPDKNPMFLEKRVYQGSSGGVYPYPVIDKIYDEKQDKSYQAVFLENRWIKIMVLPELGGRVQMALDKTNDYHFVYYNRVIKPALVGLAGPWISGGIEFNWPQHHRPNTFGSVDWRIVDNADGSKTLWCSEIDRMYGTKGMHGFTIYPDKAYLEVNVQLYNRTAMPQTFLWWANPAVHVNDDYQSVFPQDVHAVMDHGKRDVSSFPIATGTYYKVDYAPGTDISRYKNVPVPTSFMAYHSDYNFLGCYDHGKQAGMIHVANHHVAQGKKQWTWGHGDFGCAWDRQLTDNDGPYIELMCGCYTDNQPDFAWLMPYEQKSFSQYFMPYKQIGVPKNASTEVILNLDVQAERAIVGVYVTSKQRNLVVRLTRDEHIHWEKTLDLMPDQAWCDCITLPKGTSEKQLRLSVYDHTGRKMLSFTPASIQPGSVPDPAQAAPIPQDVQSLEQLFLIGRHLEQYRHATREAQSYYKEALRRDPIDSRSNNAMGMLLYKRGCFALATEYFERAINTLTKWNPNPYDSEPYYNLGLTLKRQDQWKQAYTAFYKATWSAAQQCAAYYELACIAAARGDYIEAETLVNRSLEGNGTHHKARHLKTAILRRCGRLDEAEHETIHALTLDALDLGIMFERILIAKERKQNQSVLQEAFIAALHTNVHTRIEIALDYAWAGFWPEGIELLQSEETSHPMTLYYLGWLTLQDGDQETARICFNQAAEAEPTYCFPHRLDCIAVLECAMAMNPNDARAPYYLGTYLYSRRDYDRAIALWEQARDLDPTFPTVWRNLGLAYMNKRQDPQSARDVLEKAFSLDRTDARVFYELDQLYKKLNLDPAERLEHMEKYLDLVQQRDDLTIERITLINHQGYYQEALELLEQRMFHPWEGGEGKVTGQYILALIGIARYWLESGNAIKAIENLKRAQTYPDNLGEGKLPGTVENPLHYYLGLAYEALGQKDMAKTYFTKATQGLAEPVSAIYYNDQPPDTIYYQGLALNKLKIYQKAKERFMKLINYGREHLDDQPTIDYFAVSLPDFLIFDEDLTKRNRIHCLYMMGLGYIGLGDTEKGRQCLNKVLYLDKAHFGASDILSQISGQNIKKNQRRA